MKPQEMTVQIAADPRTVFDHFADLEHAPGRLQGIKKIEFLTPGPVGRGTRFRETRIMFGRDCTEEMEITDFQPGKAYTIGCSSCGAFMATTFRFEPRAGGTAVLVRMEARPTTFFARMVMPLMSWMMSGTMLKCVRQDVDDMRRAIESRPAAATA